MADTELKVCPYCGGEGRLDKDFRFPRYNFLRKLWARVLNEPEIWAYTILCRSCAATGGWAKTKGNAIRNWNMRSGDRYKHGEHNG